MKSHSDCPKCLSQDVDEINSNFYLGDYGGIVLFQCCDCGYTFSEHYGLTTFWFEDTIKEVKDIKNWEEEHYG